MNTIFLKEAVIAGIFLLAILCPVSGMLLKPYVPPAQSENNWLAKPPPLTLSDGSIGKFPYEYTLYFNDHFGFRNSLSRVNFFIRHDLLGASPMKEVLFGKDGWLFWNADGAVEDYRGITGYDATTLDHWAKTLEMKRVWLEKQGIRYLFVVAPNKSSIYGEYLPESYNRVCEKTGLDTLLEYLKTHTEVVVVDLRPALLAAKANKRVYHKTDTHWNEYGAFFACREIMKPVARWFPSLKIPTVDEYLIENKLEQSGDLARIFGGSEYITEEHINLKPFDNNSLKIDGIDSVKIKSVTVTHNDSSLLRAVVFRDSFFWGVAPFFAEHFKYSRYYWQYWDSQTPIEEILSITKPDIVIEEIVERFIKNKMGDFVASPPIIRSMNNDTRIIH